MRILSIAGDAGGARALAPVIRQLRRTDGITVECWAYAAAVEIWDMAGFHPGEVGPLDACGFGRILLGTTVGSEQWELQIIQRARERKVRTVSVVDFWIHYRERFTAADGSFILPDAIAVMDIQTRQEMIAVGFPAERLHISGQPAFDELAHYDNPDTRQQARTRLRKMASCTADEPCILYASQPLSQLFSKDTLGFHEREVLIDVIRGLEYVLDKRLARAVLIFKLHPLDMRALYPLPPSNSQRLTSMLVGDADLDPREMVVGCDLVIGMNSTLLMEACLLKKPVISYQPEIRIPDPLPSNRLGWSRAVLHREELEEALEAELFDSKTRAERTGLLATIPLMRGATERVVEFLLSAS